MKVARLIKNMRRRAAERLVQQRVVQLMAAALLATSQSCFAQTVPDATYMRLSYGFYRDYQSGAEDRMEVRTPSFWFDTALSRDLELEGGLTYDSMSGASPLYLDSLSGASGKGVEDDRLAGDLKITKYFENFSIGFGGTASDENDYLGRTLLIDGKIWGESKNTVFSWGVSRDWDRITSDNDSELNEDRSTMRYLLGVTQIISEDLIIQSNITVASGHGYYDDPYKVFEHRPRSRDEYAWLTRFNYFVEQTKGSAHFDYRYAGNSWEVHSHMFGFRFYQPLSEHFTIAPLARYYRQDQASFYKQVLPPQTFEDTFSTGDQRLGGFSGLTLGMKLIFPITKTLELSLLYEHLRQCDTGTFREGADKLKDFSADYGEIALGFKF